VQLFSLPVHRFIDFLKVSRSVSSAVAVTLSWDSSLGIATECRLDDQMIGV
jgi:hypothetical protein